MPHLIPPTTELNEQNGHPSLGKDGNQKVQGQRKGPAREQLRSLWFAEQQLHLRLRHLSGEVHWRGGEEEFWLFFFFKLHFLCSNCCGLFQTIPKLLCESGSYEFGLLCWLQCFCCVTNSLLNVTCMKSSNRLDEEKRWCVLIFFFFNIQLVNNKNAICILTCIQFNFPYV